MRNRSTVLGSIVIAAACALPTLSYGDPPPWAPAHGWRKKNDPNYIGYTGRKWGDDYGVVSAGVCNREAVGAVLGAAVGGAVGSQVGGGDGRKIAILVGTVAGAVIGAKIGRDMDQADRACIAHALELVQGTRRVSWSGSDGRVRYVLTPVRNYAKDGRDCREFTLRATFGGHSESSTNVACQAKAGTWELVG